MVEVFVAIGSNVDRERHVRDGIAQLRARFGALRVSPVYESEAVGFRGSPFYNLVVAFETGLAPLALASQLREIEHQCGRDPAARKFAPRPLDLDLLLYGDAVMEQDGLRLPRADILRYGFVLKPLADLVPDRRHPVAGKTYAEFWSAFDGEGKAVRLVTIAPRTNF